MIFPSPGFMVGNGFLGSGGSDSETKKTKKKKKSGETENTESEVAENRKTRIILKKISLNSAILGRKMFRISSFDKNLENATSHLRLEPDWPSILLICDAIRQNDVTAKHAFQAIKKKMMSPNPHTAYYALLVLESVVKNCGTPMHEEISTKESCEMFSTFIEQTPHENVRQKMLELIQTWAYAFRTSEKYQAIKDTMTILKAKGHNFPELVEADAMFTADTAPDWADGKVCHRCRVEFSFTQRKHHCRNCGQIFCAQCSSKQCPLPKYGIEKEVRVCDGCYAQLQKPSTAKPRIVENDLPAEYLTSSLAQQSQTPPRKSEQELKEEEELQLALALSQSEAEEQQKKKQQSQITNYRIMQRSPSPEAPPAPVNHSISLEETPSDPELAKYLNRSYWEQRKTTESPASPSAPSPMPQLNNVFNNKITSEDAEIDDFANNMKSQVEIFVNRMKSNSSRGRSISNDSSVQTLFMNLTSLHSRLLTYIKEMDDKRMWYEQLQDKLTQVRDSRAALDVLRQEHIEKLRRIAEEQERQRQLQMAHKLEIMRKKKQEYLQYQRQLALQRIQEQEREMQMRQEQQKAQYRMGQAAFGFMPPNQQGSPSHQMPAYGTIGYSQGGVQPPRFLPQGALPPQTQSGIPMPGMYSSGISPVPNQPNMPNVMMGGQIQNMPPPNAPPQQPSQGNIPSVQAPNGLQQSTQMNTIPGPAGAISNKNQSVINTGVAPPGSVSTGVVVTPSPAQNFNVQSQSGTILPSTQNSNPNIPQGAVQTMIHNNQSVPMPRVSPPQQQSQQQPQPQPQPQPQLQTGQLSSASQLSQPVAPSEDNNGNQQNLIQNQSSNTSVTSAKKNSKEEIREVQTAELISFD